MQDSTFGRSLLCAFLRVPGDSTKIPMSSTQLFQHACFSCGAFLNIFQIPIVMVSDLNVTDVKAISRTSEV